MPEGKSPGGTCLPIAAVLKTEGILRGDKCVCKYHYVFCVRHKCTALFHGPGNQPPAVFCQSQIATLEAMWFFTLK